MNMKATQRVPAVLGLLVTSIAVWLIAAAPAGGWDGQRHPVAREHPRLLGTRAELQRLAAERAAAYERVRAVALGEGEAPHQRMLSAALVGAIEEDRASARRAIDMAMRYIEGPIRRGHTPFGHDLAQTALVFDLCHEHWTEEERAKFVAYVNDTVDANVGYGASVFHNGWWGYKNWGVGVACYASYHENPRAAEILRDLERDYRERAAPALELAGAGGGWAEGYYIHYWLYEWLVFCEVARTSEGVDYHALAPGFYRQRAIASLFEMYPGIDNFRSRRPIPMGDGGGRIFGGDRDKVLSARRILVSRYRDDPAHQAVHAYNQLTPRSATGTNAYKDLLWHDTSVPEGDLHGFRLSHLSPGPGYVHARSSWDDDATYFFFKCGDRFTSHQHLDVGHFLIYRHAELAGDGGHYDTFGSPHDVNYHMRTIAHNTILVHDPQETWPAIRAGQVSGNDGGQHHNWPHHNGDTIDPQRWLRQRDLYDLADLLAFEDRQSYLYIAGDATRAYAPRKMERFTRQIVFLRPGTFVIFDQVRSTQTDFRKTWLLQAMQEPVRQDDHLVITNGQGRLFVQTLLPQQPQVRLAAGDDLYRYDGQHFPPARDTGAAPRCRIEVSPGRASREDFFLHVLTATDASVAQIAPAAVQRAGEEVVVTLEGARVGFEAGAVGGWIEIDGRRRALTDRVLPRE